MELKQEFEIREMITDKEIMATFAVMKQLRLYLHEDQYLERIKLLCTNYGYRLVTVVVEGNVRSVAGFRILENLAWEKFLYVDDLVTDEQSRSHGYAQRIIDWLVDEAKRNQCEQLHLDSGVQRFAAHRFYLRNKMDITSHHFQKSL